MLLCEVVQNQKSLSDTELEKLIESVSKWCSNYSETSRVDRDRIKRYIPYFQYSGKMFRTVFLFTRGGVDDAREAILNNYRRGKGLSSWSKTEEGMYNWLDQLGEDIDFPRGANVLDEIRCVQQSVGFDVDKFYQYITNHLTLNIDKHVKFNIERAAEVEEVIALYSSDLQAQVEETFYKHGSW